MKRYAVNLPDDFLKKVVKAIRSNDQHAEAIYLFGSYVRGEEGPESDVDIYVVTGGPHPLFATKERTGAEKEFKQLIKDYGLNPSVISFGPLKEFPERIRCVAFEERSVWREGILLWGSDNYRRQMQNFSDRTVPSRIYLEELYGLLKRVGFYWRQLQRKDEGAPKGERRRLYEAKICRGLAFGAIRLIDWVREANRVASLPKQSTYVKISECVEEGMIEAVPHDVEKSIDTLLNLLKNEEARASDEGDSQSLCGVDEAMTCFDNVARFLQENGYRAPSVDQCMTM